MSIVEMSKRLHLRCKDCDFEVEFAFGDEDAYKHINEEDSKGMLPNENHTVIATEITLFGRNV